MNYLIEWMYALALSLGCLLLHSFSLAFGLLRDLRKSAAELVRTRPKYPAYRPAVIFLAIALQVSLAAPQSLLFLGKDKKWEKEYEALRSLVASTAGPIISDDMVLLVGAGKQVYLEPAIVAELTSLGKFDESKLLSAIARNQFAFIVTEGRDEDVLFQVRYTPAMRHAILTSYPIETELAGFTLHRPQT